MEGSAYAGDVMPADAYAALESDEDAVLIDVRTEPEWRFVGVPDLSGLGKRTRFVEWQLYPDGRPNPAFARQCEEQGLEKGRAVYFLCRSGVRSMHAAVAMTSLGYGPCYNVAEGFEGDKDTSMQRGHLGGWKVRGLPWRQE